MDSNQKTFIVVLPVFALGGLAAYMIFGSMPAPAPGKPTANSTPS